VRQAEILALNLKGQCTAYAALPKNISFRLFDMIVHLKGHLDENQNIIELPQTKEQGQPVF
jgi:hypothetical protein